MASSRVGAQYQAMLPERTTARRARGGGPARIAPSDLDWARLHSSDLPYSTLDEARRWGEWKAQIIKQSAREFASDKSGVTYAVFRAINAYNAVPRTASEAKDFPPLPMPFTPASNLRAVSILNRSLERMRADNRAVPPALRIPMADVSEALTLYQTTGTALFEGAATRAVRRTKQARVAPPPPPTNEESEEDDQIKADDANEDEYKIAYELRKLRKRPRKMNSFARGFIKGLEDWRSQ